MAGINFGKDGAAQTTAVAPVEVLPAATAVPAEAKPVQQVQESAAPAPAATQALAAPARPRFGDRIPGLDDIMVPYINVVHPLSKELVGSFPVGSLVYGKTTLLYTPADIDTTTGNVRRAATAPVNVTVLGLGTTRYAEKVKGGVGGMLLGDLDMVRRVGGTTDYNEWQLKQKDGMRMFDTLEELFLLVRRPEICADDGSVFVFECEGHKYALAKMNVKATAYTEVLKSGLYLWRKAGCMANDIGYPSRQVRLTTYLKPFKKTGNSAWVPQVAPGDANTPAFLSFAHQLIGA